MSPRTFQILFVCVSLLVAGIPAAWAGPGSPVISHRALQSAAQGQSLSVRAQVESPTDPLESVSLFFTTSTDSAPVRIPMKESADNIWAGTIPADFLAGYTRLNYYIAAANSQGLTAETPWYRVKLLSLSAPSATRPATTTPIRSQQSPETSERSWVKPALIAGGAVAVAGGIALAVSGGGGGGGGDDSGSADPAPDISGTYAGSVTTCYAANETQCETHMMAITVGNDGYASSDTLVENQFLRAPVNGNNFRFTDAVSTTSRTGEIIFDGTVLDDRIVGSISGSATETDGTSGSYSGTFNATRQ
jgi:hypothetical protein